MSDYKGFPRQASSIQTHAMWIKQQEIDVSRRGCDEGGARCGLAQLQAVIEAAACALQTLMQDARGGLIR
jgi:hypothetical protein